MTALAIIGTTFLGAGVGFVVGWWMGEQEGGDFNIAPALYAPAGACVGGGIGVIAGSVIFA